MRHYSGLDYDYCKMLNDRYECSNCCCFDQCAHKCIYEPVYIKVPVEKEVIVEKPIETIVEKIVEIPVEKEVIKEIIIEKPVETIVEKIIDNPSNTIYQTNNYNIQVPEQSSLIGKIYDGVKMCNNSEILYAIAEILQGNDIQNSADLNKHR